jgi:hypothetical protein
VRPWGSPLPADLVIAGELRGGLLQEGPGDGPIKAEHRLAVQRLPWTQRDPMDRLLVAQAIQDDLSRGMADPALTGVGGRVIWVPARAPEG